MGVVDELLRTSGSNLPPTKNGDHMRWKLMKNGNFDIQSFYNKLRGPLPIIFLWKSIWKVKALWRIFFIFWITVWDKILTGNNFQGRDFDTGALCFIVMEK